MDKLLNLFAQLGQLLPDLEVGDHALLVGDLDGVILLLILLDFCTGNIGKKKKDKNKTLGLWLLIINTNHMKGFAPHRSPHTQTH